ncbi:hypothetical protein OG455_30465 [Kitasatospora sp. NBC_01287]|uniref:hypothetical protein n=1 Tax=Kitasatospora sp. NBC_01287 TaxID=2903573 RepID=UPI00224DA828|nr:hypothetical protein [Kitasatospora sp. NBC_01287]MCX4749788.1 hypothetical protein [Kitasatospora sp. NBC_01287]
MVLPLIGLLVALLVAIPCAGSARAATPPPPAPVKGLVKGLVKGPVKGPVKDPAQTTRATPADHATPTSRATDTAHTAHTAKAGAHRAAGLSLAPVTLCALDSSDPRPGDGCSSHSFGGQDAQLPNAPPQPGPTNLPLLVAVHPVPASGFPSTGPGSAPAPDLHLLQVNRT